MKRKSKNTAKKVSYYQLQYGDSFYQVPVAEICRRIGVHPKTVYRWSKGTQRPDQNTLELMRIIFIGILPFPGWESYRIKNSGVLTYHKQPIYTLYRNDGRVSLNTSQIEGWELTATYDRDKLKYVQKQLDAVMSERDALQQRVTLLNDEVQRLQDKLPKAEVIPLPTKKKG